MRKSGKECVERRGRERVEQGEEVGERDCREKEEDREVKG